MTHTMNKQDTVALITGATGGIGRAIASKLYAENATLVLVGRDIQSLNMLSVLLSEKYPSEGSVFVCQADLATQQGREDLYAFIITLPVKVNMMINSAGINEFIFLDQQSDTMLEDIMHINAISPMLLIKKLLPYFKKQEKVQIINVGSTFGSIGYPGYCSYSASKFALRGFTEALARECADSTVRVRYFSPRATTTSLNASTVVEMNKELKVHMDSPEYVAEKLMQFINGNAFATYLGWPEKFFVRLNQLFPAVVSNAIGKTLPVIRRYAQL